MRKPDASRRTPPHTEPASPEDGSLSVKLSRQANRWLKDGALADADAAFKEVLELEPGNSYALVGLAQIAKRRGDLPKAINFYQICLQLTPYNSVAMLGLADAYRSGDQWSKALALWEKHLELHSSDAAVWTYVADAQRRAQHWDKAQKAYATALQHDPKNAFALVGLGYLHYDQKDFVRALSCWSQAHAVNASKTDLRLLTNLGNCHRKLKSFDLGVPFFQQALDLQPDNFFALFGLADCYRGLRQPEQSLTYWERILANDPHNRIVLTRAGDALRQMGHIDAAQQRYEAALEDGYDCFAAMGLATVLKIKGRYQEALAQLQTILDIDPGNARVQQIVGDCQQRLQHPPSRS